MKQVFIYIYMMLTFLATTAFASNQSGMSRTLRNKDLEKGKIYISRSQIAPNHSSDRRMSFWVCTNPLTHPVSVECDELGINELEGPKEELQIAFATDSDRHEYGLRHGVTQKECRRMRRKILAMMASNKNEICFLGDLAGYPMETSNSSKISPIGWVFNEAKTATASESWF